MLSERQKNILKYIVEEYIKTARPISSNAVCEKLECSSATIRNEMVHLENMELLEKNHFASGRIPSEKGYRYYVDNLMQPKHMTGEDVLKLQRIFENNALDLNDTIKRSIEIVSEITNYTTVVLGNSAKDNCLKKVEIVPLEGNKILTMVITDKGFVEHKTLFLPKNISVEEVRKTVDLINKLLIGTPLDLINEQLEYSVKPVIGKYVRQHELLYNTFYDAFSEITNKEERVHFAGRTNFLKQPEFNDVEKVKELFTKFEDENCVKEIAEDKKGINVYVGSDSELSDDVSIVKTHYNVDGEEGTIAIIGPKRMEYDKAVSLLDYIKSNIGGDYE